MKLVYKKGLLHKQRLHVFVACFALEAMPSPSAHSCVKMKPENIEMKLVFMWLVSDIMTLYCQVNSVCNTNYSLYAVLFTTY